MTNVKSHKNGIWFISAYESVHYWNVIVNYNLFKWSCGVKACSASHTSARYGPFLICRRRGLCAHALSHMVCLIRGRSLKAERCENRQRGGGGARMCVLKRGARVSVSECVSGRLICHWSPQIWSKMASCAASERCDITHQPPDTQTDTVCASTCRLSSALAHQDLWSFLRRLSEA